MSTKPESFRLQRLRGTVAQLHASSAASVAPAGQSGGGLVRTARLMEPTDSALVLGSSQASTTADALACAGANVDVVRRRSGGGAVLVQPGAQLWVDLLLPAGDPLADDDVGRAAWWVGEAWAAALHEVGLSPARVWKGPMLRRPWSCLVCFALVGAGEVTVPNGAKVVGISQRRTRLGALFQCSCLLRWQPEELTALLALSTEERARAAEELAGLAVPAPKGSGEQLLVALLAALA